MGKCILIISPEPWTHIFVSKHHYAIELAHRGHRVFFLNPPSQVLGVVLSQAAGYEQITVVDYGLVCRGQRFLPAFMSRFIDRQLLSKIQKLARIKFDVIWNFENSRFFDFRFAGPGVLKIYHQVDLNQQFNLPKAAITADICFCTTELIRKELLRYSKRVFKIHHGVSSAALCATTDGAPVQDTVAERKRAKAMYIGNLNMAYLDIALMQEVVLNCPEVDFEMVGPYYPEGDLYRQLHLLKNCFFTGKVDSKQLPKLIATADILMVVYQQEKHKDQASPHKMMNYLASGKAIVATFTEEYADKPGLILMSQKNSEYAALFKTAIANLSYVNSLEQINARKAFAADNTYPKQMDRIIEFIRAYVPGKTLG